MSILTTALKDTTHSSQTHWGAEEGFNMLVAAEGSVPSFLTGLSFWWQAAEAESAGLRNREEASALFLQCTVPSSLVGHRAAECRLSTVVARLVRAVPLGGGQLGQARSPSVQITAASAPTPTLLSLAQPALGQQPFLPFPPCFQIWVLPSQVGVW